RLADDRHGAARPLRGVEGGRSGCRLPALGRSLIHHGRQSRGLGRRRLMAIRVAQSNLDAIGAQGIAVPRYERSALAPRILHLGVGGFHRAHMALYTDELAESSGDWGIRGIGLLDADRRMASVLQAQDHLYTLIERDSDESRTRIIGSIVDYVLVAGDVDGFAQQVAGPDVAILSMTITEGGYSLAKPNPTIEAIAAGLDARRAAGG